MKIKTFLLLTLLIAVAACQLSPANHSSQTTARTAISSGVESTPTGSTALSQPTGTAESSQSDNYAGMFTGMYIEEYGEVALKTYQPVNYQAQFDTLPVDLSSIGNPEVIQGLTDQQKEFLSQNGFVVLPTGDLQFGDISNSTALENGQPYYLTTDAAYHGLHTTFDDLLASLEEEYMRPVLWKLLQSEYAQVSLYMQEAKGTEIEADVQLSLDYLAVAIKLLYPEQELEKDVEERIAPQIHQILSYGGIADSALIPNFKDDYGAYRPVSHYAGNLELENYFHAMTWFGRVAFKFKDPDEPGLIPSRAPIILTLALNEGKLGGKPLYETWLTLHELIDFMIGPSDDPGPTELNELMFLVYGEDIAFNDFLDGQKWEQFLSQTDQLPAPKINSTFATFSIAQEQSRDWRFMGQVFTLDGFIFQNLVFDKVGTIQNPRMLPSGLDVAAAFGSKTAYQLQDQYGVTAYENYPEQMETLQEIVNKQPQEEWTNRFYSSWLYAFLPQVEPKVTAFPPFMGTQAWTFKDMNSMLGSWAELKHDTVLYAKMPEMLGGGGPPTSPAAPSYVEPNPQVFYRLSYAAKMLHFKLYLITNDWSNMGYHEYPNSSGWNPGFYEHYQFLGVLVQRFEKIGDIAAKELNHEALTEDDMWIIQACITEKECMDNGAYTENEPEPDPIPVIAAVAGANNEILEAGVGNLNRIYVAVPLEGKLEIAQGGVFSYYEFSQPREHRLTDEEWQEMLANHQASLPEWVSEFVLPGGSVVDSLAFRIGDIYIITEAGGNPPLNLRAEPTTTSEKIRQYTPAAYIKILDGPVINSEGTWWKVADAFDAWMTEDTIESGWVMQNPAWYVRSY